MHYKTIKHAVNTRFQQKRQTQHFRVWWSEKIHQRTGEHDLCYHLILPSLLPSTIFSLSLSLHLRSFISLPPFTISLSYIIIPLHSCPSPYPTISPSISTHPLVPFPLPSYTFPPSLLPSAYAFSQPCADLKACVADLRGEQWELG